MFWDGNTGNKRRPTAGLFTFLYCHLKTTQFLYNRCLPLDVASFPGCPHMGTKHWKWTGRSSDTNLSSENNLLTFRLNAAVVIRVKVKKLFSKLKLVSDKPLKALKSCVGGEEWSFIVGGYCEGGLSSHLHSRQSVYPRFVYSLATYSTNHVQY